MNKTLIGKNNILFLMNDSAKELEVHCNNLNLVVDKTLSRYNFENTIFFVYPNKSLIYKDFLPDEYIVKYRPALDIYKKKFGNKLFDFYEILKDELDVYYKTDAHINLKGNYIVYKYFINILNSKLNLNIIPKDIILDVKNCELKTLPYGIGDLTWESNLGQQHLEDIKDNFYFNDEVTWFYCIYKITNDSDIRFLDYNLNDNTEQLEGQHAYWNIISDYIIYKKNIGKVNVKIVIFYDSFLLHILPLYFDLFNDIYFVKNIYNGEIINLIQPDFVFEFRVERFLF
jgi:hypothetical protein